MHTGGDDPFRSRGRRAEDDAFAARGRFIWFGIGLIVLLAGVGVWWMFR